LRNTQVANVILTEARLVSLPTSGAACRMRGVARPVPGSRIGFELWLPQRGWNGRYYQIGNGGFAGSVHSPSLAAEAARGNAAAATDTGHRADAFDASWAQNNPVAVVDYGHRSIKATSDAAAALIRAYYGRGARWRYFAGCSNGGRQALMAAQRYPEDWDGILAGAPANPWTEQLITFVRLQTRLRADPAAWLPPAKLPLIQRAALASCPAGTVVNGVATDPPACRLDIARLICRGQEHGDCLTAMQAESLGHIIAAGYLPTAAAYPNNWDRWILNADPNAQSQTRFATQAVSFLFDGGTSPSSHIREALDARDVTYNQFRARGGRIISYFGWADAVISPLMGRDYYRRVVAQVGGATSARSFYRLFMVPGMGHCQGGLGADSFGQSPVSPPLRRDAAHDARVALEMWVETSRPPDTLVAARYENLNQKRRVIDTQILQPTE
jgi:feruloyl esterase